MNMKEIKIKIEDYEAIEKMMSLHPEYGYMSVDEFVAETLRLKIFGGM